MGKLFLEAKVIALNLEYAEGDCFNFGCVERVPPPTRRLGAPSLPAKDGSADEKRMANKDNPIVR
jgi:hypothetical protein